MSQRDIVLRKLRDAGEAGVSARDFVYQDGITRSAAIVYDLRQREGFNIETVDEGYTDTRKKRMARYILHEERPAPRRLAPPPETGQLFSEELGLEPIRFDCGCIRSADGRKWEKVCVRHAGTRFVEVVAW